MSATSETESKEKFPPLTRKETVVMGRLGYFSIVLRLIGVELYKLRRRTMSWVLGSIITLALILVFAFTGFYALTVRSTPIEAYKQTATGELSDAQALQVKQATLISASQSLRLPNSLTTSAQVIDYVGLILVIILAGTIVGGEYSVGTVRLLFTRGPTRTQYFLAKLGTLLTCIALITFVLTALGVIIGALLNTMAGLGGDWHFLTAAWLGHALLYLLTVIFNLFMYATIAVFLATLGRATAAGVAGTLIWWVLENVFSGLLAIIGSFSRGTMSGIAKAIPNYFISNNLDALQQNQQQFLLGASNQPPTITTLHALLVLATYFVVFSGLAWWIMKQRDVTN